MTNYTKMILLLPEKKTEEGVGHNQFGPKGCEQLVRVKKRRGSMILDDTGITQETLTKKNVIQGRRTSKENRMGGDRGPPV